MSQRIVHICNNIFTSSHLQLFTSKTCFVFYFLPPSFWLFFQVGTYTWKICNKETKRSQLQGPEFVFQENYLNLSPHFLFEFLQLLVIGKWVCTRFIKT